jgi:hypothetical protein
VCGRRDADVDAVEDDGKTITIGDRGVLCCGGCDCACDWDDLVDVCRGVLAATHTGVEE